MKKLIPLLIIIILAFGAVSATSFPAPTAPAPAGNIVPVHTGIQQTKNGNLSVDNFIARAVADFRQQIYINNTNLGKTAEGEKGNMKGSSVVAAENANLVIFGGVIENDPADDTDDTTFNTSVIGTDIITAKNFLQSWNVSHDATIAQKRDLCADADGNVVFCKVAIAEVDVCANIQGAQTNPPTGMVRNGENCEWVVILPPPPPALAVGTIGVSMRPVMGGTLDDHYECMANLNKKNDTGKDIYLAISFEYNFIGSGNPNRSEMCYVTISNGEDGGTSMTYPIDPSAQIKSQCLEPGYPTETQGASIPTGMSC
jgi:hypothetical protein